MNEWLIQQGVGTPQTGLVVGLLAGLVVAALLSWWLSRRGAAATEARLQPALDTLEADLREARGEPAGASDVACQRTDRIDATEDHVVVVVIGNAVAFDDGTNDVCAEIGTVHVAQAALAFAGRAA